MKRILLAILFLVAGFAIAAEPTWKVADATKEAEKDIQSGHIKFYWSGSEAVSPVGVPMELAKKYPRADAGVGCVVTDVALRERQEEYARRYNAIIQAYLKKRE